MWISMSLKEAGRQLLNPAVMALLIMLILLLTIPKESERAERQREGDLDQYERVMGTEIELANLMRLRSTLGQQRGTSFFPQYIRTAEREAELIRPMPILQKTMNYLFNLWNLPSDDSLLPWPVQLLVG